METTTGKRGYNTMSKDELLSARKNIETDIAWVTKDMSDNPTPSQDMDERLDRLNIYKRELNKINAALKE
jgi:hypothetical protein